MDERGTERDPQVDGRIHGGDVEEDDDLDQHRRPAEQPDVDPADRAQHRVLREPHQGEDHTENDPDRHAEDREKTVDFVTYATAGESFFVNADGGPTINSLDDICGLKVGAEKGTTEADDAAAQSQKCTAAGKDAVEVSTFQDEAGVNVALSSGRIDAGFADTPVADYAVKQSDGKFKLSPAPSIANAPYGIAMAKDSGLQQPVLAAIKALMADGTYAKIFDYWGLSGAKIDNPTINGAID